MLLELAIGDAYGAGFEYADPAFVRQNNDLSAYVKHPRHEIKPGCYTDDTQMSLAIAELLVEGVPWTRENLADRFVEVFERDPRQGYAGGFYKFLKQVDSGGAFLAKIRPHSDKSGAAMRAAPLGVLPSIDEVLHRCEIQARITHDTVDGVAAAQAAALLSHHAIYRLGPREQIGIFLEGHVPGKWNEPWRGEVGSRGWMSVRAAITTIRRSKSIAQLLKQCVSFCGDVDTVASIALAAGAHYQDVRQDLPASLKKRLENGRYGKRYLVELNRKLFKLVKRDSGQEESLIKQLKERLSQIEPELAQQPFVHLHTFSRDGQTLHVAVTERLRKKCRKAGVWKSREMLKTLKNASYGYDEQHAHSPGGYDGLFLLDRDYRPSNTMMKKLCDQFLDHSRGEAREIAQTLNAEVTDLKPVRLVSHHLRLLGVLHRAEDENWLVLVDCDRSG